ncbi:MAG: NADH-quinone oxidoreductase subunit N [Deltaproteobacteria bacterium]|nr:NADH-quinone oxidoreductase subunit N [Deltaproteobacteria bacterium]
MTFVTTDMAYIAPLLILTVTGMLLVIAESFFRGRDRAGLMGLAVAGSVASFVASVVLYRQLEPGSSKLIFDGMLVADRFGFALTGLFSVITALVAMSTPAHQREHGWENGEYYAILLLSAAGMTMLAQAAHLVAIFIGVETMSIGVYVMTALRRRSRRGNEAALKYFLMGAFATGFLLYGMALVYGAAGTAELAQMKTKLLATANPEIAIAGILLMVIAFGFKLAAVPFHMWAPDAYEGAPTPVTAFMAAGVKAAAVAAMIRLFGQYLGGDVLPFGAVGWASPMVIIAGLTITVGNIAAVRQNNVKRMLAYSSISHGGVMLVGLAAMGLGSSTGQSSLVYYLIAYSITTIASFAVVSWVGSRDRERLLVDDWAGLGQKHPAAALAMTVALLSLGGLPPTAGFFGKFYVFKSAMDVADNQLIWLVAIGVVNSAISIYYYLRLVTAMYFREPTEPFTPSRSAPLEVVMVLCPIIILAMGLLPGFWLGLGN